MGLRPCGSCRRHVHASEASCPFCRAELAPVAPRFATIGGRLGRAAIFAGATLAGSACWSQSQPREKKIEHDTVEAKPGPIEVKPGPLDVGTIRGFVRDGRTGALMPNFRVMLQHPDGTITNTTSDQRGEYVFKNLAPGNYVVHHPPTHPRQGPVGMTVLLGADKGQEADVTVYFPEPDRGPCCKPYGAPPARRRVV